MIVATWPDGAADFQVANCKSSQGQVRHTRQPLRHPPEVGQHVLWTLELDAQEPEIARRHFAHQSRSSTEVERQPGNHGSRQTRDAIKTRCA